MLGLSGQQHLCASWQGMMVLRAFLLVSSARAEAGSGFVVAGP